MLQAVELTDYTVANEYAIKQARALINEKGPKTASLDFNEDEEAPGEIQTKG